MIRSKTYQEIIKFFDGVGLYSVPIPIAGSPLAASPFPYLMIDGQHFAFRRLLATEDVFDEEYLEYCEWANEKLKQQGKPGISVVFHRRMLRLFKTENHLVDRWPTT